MIGWAEFLAARVEAKQLSEGQAVRWATLHGIEPDVLVQVAAEEASTTLLLLAIDLIQAGGRNDDAAKTRELHTHIAAAVASGIIMGYELRRQEEVSDATN